MDNILETINKSGLRLLEPLTLSETYEIIVKEAIRLVDAAYGSLTLISGDKFSQVYSTLPITVKRRKKGFTYKALKSRKILIVNTEKTDGFLKLYPDYQNLGIKSVVLIPLFYKKEAIGVLAINSFRSEHFNKRELDILQLFGSFATLAIRKNQLYDEVKKALEIRDLFISMAAHELRTPLTSVNGYIQLLRSKQTNSNTPESRWIEQLYGESLRMTSLVNELLEINRIRSGKLNFILKECHVGQLIRKIENDLKVSYPNRKFVIEDQTGDRSDLVIGDSDKISQALFNLVENAIKFSPESTPVVMNLKNKSGNLIVQVKDKGVGIPKKDLDLIFRAFQQGEHSREGLGLGLYLVNNIVENLRGNIKISSKINKGTTVEVIFPQART
ncbi:MAG: multi-sensor signal transduction histidine kinase [uncultured bacterium]|uniref:histidine kinase n=3 Tax=Candidatus Daviesiibacteriota TaxID=1752718 RepID=A0A1F5K187_9BACT|nr:MAG: multi-sensor signal transduction histidine kinase [uncultured bacterium]KKQ14895.1 MAG: histidine kinase [Candidatus Daviesbacteria bacterium GW2011_GWA1_36_8]OGE16646.1 MAG: hypothetical protein A2858_02270 [Candidatus Daviesbacteria bacterium RIFCSPHIGHO2_01_FULL_36_37]OGE33377.1 MAG: hypothetical protein A3C99_01660 [Candidatus Daviesbacteria bacterium RIFCSPHIGHO2_02_FULL_37_9]OGE34722.1 MAG: hypothetical protein A3E66_03790 [Candidatus Daviesbacteria bacterium RIFCSPHIGHO2_12_FULL_